MITQFPYMNDRLSSNSVLKISRLAQVQLFLD